MANSICRLNQFGHCKFGELCHFKHTKEICETESCELKGCTKDPEGETTDNSSKAADSDNFESECFSEENALTEVDIKEHEEEIEFFKCDECNFKTIKKNGLKIN